MNSFTIIPPHDANNNSKLSSMISFLEQGGKLPSVVMLPTGKCITGSHRYEAYKTLGSSLPALIISERDYRLLKDKYWTEIKKCINKKSKDISRVFQFYYIKNLQEITDDSNLKNALRGQNYHYWIHIYNWDLDPISFIKEEAMKIFFEIFGEETQMFLEDTLDG